MTARNEWDGSLGEILVTTGSIADGNFTVATTNSTITTYDNTGTSDKWTSGKIIFTGTFASAPADGKTVDIYRWEVDIDGTSGHDEGAPDLAEKDQATYVGSIILDDSASVQYGQCVVPMIGVKKCKFGFYNNSGVALNTGATLDFEGLGMNDS